MLWNVEDANKSNLDMNDAIHRMFAFFSFLRRRSSCHAIPVRHVFLGELGRGERERRRRGDGIFFKVLGAHSPTRRTFVIDLAAEFSVLRFILLP